MADGGDGCKFFQQAPLSKSPNMVLDHARRLMNDGVIILEYIMLITAQVIWLDKQVTAFAWKLLQKHMKTLVRTHFFVGESLHCGFAESRNH